jgi:hypothetical protein
MDSHYVHDDEADTDRMRHDHAPDDDERDRIDGRFLVCSGCGGSGYGRALGFDPRTRTLTDHEPCPACRGTGIG